MVQRINLNLEQQICISALIFCTVRKICLILSLLLGLMTGRQAGGRQADRKSKYGWILNFLKVSTGLTIQTFILFIISLQCYCSVRTVFQSGKVLL